MASRSPIVVDSSPQALFRSPSITPQRDRRTSSVAFSSSPGLAELPTFAKVPAKGLKSGSNAQQVPQRAALGFASAATLFNNGQATAKSKVGDQERASDAITYDVEKHNAPPGKSSGKLSKPKKTDKSRTTAKRKKPSDPKCPLLKRAEERQPGILDNGDRCPYLGQAKSRTPGIPLSEYDSRPEEYEALPAVISAPPKPEKKQRQRGVQSEKKDLRKKPRRGADCTMNSKDAARLKPKKQFTKSASIIFDSDDSDADALSTAEGLRNDSLAGGPRDGTKHLKGKEEASPSKTPCQVEKATESWSVEAVAANKSTYSAEEPRKDRAESRPPVEPVAVFPTLMAAPRRRLSWTPAKNTVGSTTAPDARPGTASSTESEARTKSLASLISGFEYTEGMSKPVSHDRTSTGEALTKRRRLELADATTIAPTKRKPAAAIPSESKKKIKKKPQTITALATKAYHHESESVPVQPTVSEFFDVEPPANMPGDTGAAQLSEHGMVKKPRKTRAKKPNDEAATLNTKKPRHPKKTRIKSNEKDYLAKLHTPDEARAQEQSQDFLFATSSQLAHEESPLFIRDIQAAIFESESIPVAPTRDYTRSDGHGQISGNTRRTRVSAVRADSHFWNSAARDEDGRCLELDTDWEWPRPIAQVSKADTRAPLASIIVDQSHAADASKASAQKRGEASNLSGMIDHFSDRDPQADFQHTTIDLCQTSPINDASWVDPGSHIHDPVGVATSNAPPAVSVFSPAQNRPDNEWTVLSSDDSVQRLSHDALNPISTPPRSQFPAPYYKPHQLVRSASSPVIPRTVLQNLDANAGLLSHTSQLKDLDPLQQRSLTSTATDQVRRPRGRPRKIAATTMAVASSPKRRGRPPKSARVDTSATIPSIAASDRQPTISASQPTKPRPWANIDEISDSDSPSTPSPPRQRAGSSPPVLQPLELRVVTSPSLRAKAPAVVTSTLKSTDANFADIQTDLFPEISATIRSTSPSIDMKNPTWHEKILLYDPIVLEDLTAWLTEQGLGIEMQRLKPEPKAKGRKKKDAPANEPEYETVKEELKPWMVQKWCEEKSICCLWKEGLRGGVRTRY